MVIIAVADVAELTCGDIYSWFCGTGAAIDGLARTTSAGACSLACETWSFVDTFPTMCGTGGTVGEYCMLKIPENNPGYNCKWTESGGVPACADNPVDITFYEGDPANIEGLDDAPPTCPSHSVTCYYNNGKECASEGAIDGQCHLTQCYPPGVPPGFPGLNYNTEADCVAAESANFVADYYFEDGPNFSANTAAGTDQYYYAYNIDDAYRRRLPALESLEGSPDYSALKEVLHRRLAQKKKSKDASAPVKSLWCYDVVKGKIKKNFKIIAGVGFITVCYQIFGTIFACVVARAIKKSRKEKESAAQIAQNVGQRR